MEQEGVSPAHPTTTLSTQMQAHGPIVHSFYVHSALIVDIEMIPFSSARNSQHPYVNINNNSAQMQAQPNANQTQGFERDRS
jgi:hypothetical protein